MVCQHVITYSSSSNIPSVYNIPNSGIYHQDPACNNIMEYTVVVVVVIFPVQLTIFWIVVFITRFTLQGITLSTRLKGAGLPCLQLQQQSTIHGNGFHTKT